MRVFILLVVLLIPLTAEAKESAFKADYFKLDNGMDVIVIPNHRAPVVSHMVWYRVGAADEPRGKSGIAHFLEHLMFKGTEKIKPGEFSTIVRNRGGNDNAFTSQDYTGYYQNIAKEYLELVMELEADRMRNLSLTKDHVDSERLVILEERRQRIENNPASRFHEEMQYTLNVNHPYGIPVIGWEHEMEGLTQEDAISFYNQWYAPNNAILIVSGDVTMDELLPLAETHYGELEPAKLPERKRTTLVDFEAPKRVQMVNPRAGVPTFNQVYVAPSGNTGEPEDSYALDILAEIIGGTSSSRLYQQLVVTETLATGISAYYNSVAHDHGTLRIHASLAPDIEQQTLEDRINKEIEVILANGVTKEEVEEAKRRLTDSLMMERDSLDAPALILGRSLASGLDMDYVQSWPNKLQDVTVAQVNAAANKVFGPDNTPVIGWLLPEEPAE